MWEEIFNQAYDIISIILNKTILVLSAIIGVFLSSIGYPKQVILVILTLIIIDLVTKHFSIVVVNYKEFTLHNYCKAWSEKHLRSRIMKNHICVKVILYSPLLFMAHQCSVLPELKLIGGTISSMLYSLLLLTEGQSILENFIDCGYAEAMPFLKIFKKKKEDLLDTKMEDKK